MGVSVTGALAIVPLVSDVARAALIWATTRAAPVVIPSLAPAIISVYRASALGLTGYVIMATVIAAARPGCAIAAGQTCIWAAVAAGWACIVII